MSEAVPHKRSHVQSMIARLLVEGVLLHGYDEVRNEGTPA
jgi:hypothetical protein